MGDDNVKSLDEARAKRAPPVHHEFKLFDATNVEELVQVSGPEDGGLFVLLVGPPGQVSWALRPDDADRLALELIRFAHAQRWMERERGG